MQTFLTWAYVTVTILIAGKTVYQIYTLSAKKRQDEPFNKKKIHTEIVLQIILIVVNIAVIVQRFGLHLQD